MSAPQHAPAFGGPKPPAWPDVFSALEPHQIAARNAQHAHLYGQPAVVRPAAPAGGAR